MLLDDINVWDGISEFMDPYQPINPGFFIGTVTNTGFSIPEPAPKINTRSTIGIRRVEGRVIQKEHSL